jgi:chitinase
VNLHTLNCLSYERRIRGTTRKRALSYGPGLVKCLQTLIVALTLMFPIVANGTDDKAGEPAGDPNTGGRFVVGYYFNSGNGYDVTQILYENVTHISHAFAIPNKDGTLNIDEISSQIEGFARTVHQGNRKAIISVGGWNGSSNFSGIASDSNKRRVLVSALRAFCVSNKYDGVDIDWEYPTLDERSNVTRLIREISDTLRAGSAHFTLSIAMPPSIGERGYAIAGVMTYDYSTCVSLTADDNAPLSLAQSDINLLLGSVPPGKLLFGLPFYGRQYHCPLGAGLGARTDSCVEMAFANIPEASGGGWERRWDSTASVPYLVNQSINRVISYDDQQSIRLKCQWLKERNLGGAIIWALGQDRSDSLQPLLRIVGRELLGRSDSVKVPR